MKRMEKTTMKLLLEKYGSSHKNITHKIDLGKITYKNKSKIRVLLPYQVDEATQKQLRRFVSELVLNDFDDTGHEFALDFFLSVNIQLLRRYVGLYARIKPTTGRAKTYHLLCKSSPEEIRAIVTRFFQENGTGIDVVKEWWLKYLLPTA